MSLPVSDVWFLNVTVYEPDEQVFSSAGRVFVYDVWDGEERELCNNAVGADGTTSLTWNRSAFQNVDSTRKYPILLCKVKAWNNDELGITHLFHYPDNNQKVVIKLLEGTTQVQTDWYPSQSKLVPDDAPAVYGKVTNKENLPLSGKEISLLHIYFSNGQKVEVNLGSSISDRKGKFVIPYDVNSLNDDVSAGNTFRIQFAESSLNIVFSSDPIVSKNKRFNMDLTSDIASETDNSEFGLIKEDVLFHFNIEYPDETFLTDDSLQKMFIGKLDWPDDACIAYLQACDIFRVMCLSIEDFNTLEGNTLSIPDIDTNPETSTLSPEFFYPIAKSLKGTNFFQALEIGWNEFFNTIAQGVSGELISKSLGEDIEDRMNLWKEIAPKYFQVDSFHNNKTMKAFCHATTDSSIREELIRLYLNEDKSFKKIKNILENGGLSDTPLSGYLEELKILLDYFFFMDEWAPGVIGLISKNYVDGMLPLSNVTTFDLAKWIEVADSAGEFNIWSFSEIESLKTKNFPDDFPGKDYDEQKNIYATTLMEKAEKQFAQEILYTGLGLKITSGADQIAAIVPTDLSDAVNDFASFLSSVPELDLDGADRVQIATAVETYSAGVLSQEMIDKIVELTLILQRVYKLTDDSDQAYSLLSKGYTSAYSIARVSENEFVAESYKELDGFEEAHKIHRIASHHASELLLKVTLNQESLNLQGEALQAIPRIGYASELPVSSHPDDFFTTAPFSRINPNWETLFGNVVQCSCGHCNSVYSAAAYFVDLIQFLPKNAKNSLLSRRPDVQNIELTCTNTNTLVPYIDLVNEIFEGIVASNQFSIEDASGNWTSVINDNSNPSYHDLSILTESDIAPIIAEGFSFAENAEIFSSPVGGHSIVTGGSWRLDLSLNPVHDGPNIIDIVAYAQTFWEQDRLEAFPEHLSKSAYDSLKNQVYPLSLPFDLWFEERKIALKKSGISRLECLTKLNSSASEFIIAREILGLNQKQAEILTGIDSSNSWELWGFESETVAIKHPTIEGVTINGNWLDAMAVFPVFRNRIGLDHEQTFNVLRTAFVGGSEISTDQISIFPVSESGYQTCESDDLKINHLSVLRLNRANRFARLLNQVNWTIEELDVVLSTITPEDVDTIDIVFLSNIYQFTIDHKLSVAEFFACVDGIGLEGVGVPGKDQSLFMDLFDQQHYPVDIRNALKQILKESLGYSVVIADLPIYDKTYVSIIGSVLKLSESDWDAWFSWFGISEPESEHIVLNNASGFCLNGLFCAVTKARLLGFRLVGFLEYLKIRNLNLSVPESPAILFDSQDVSNSISQLREEKSELTLVFESNMSINTMSFLSSIANTHSDVISDENLFILLQAMDEELEIIRNTINSSESVENAEELPDEETLLEKQRRLIVTFIKNSLAEHFELTVNTIEILTDSVIKSDVAPVAPEAFRASIEDWYETFIVKNTWGSIADVGSSIIVAYRNLERLSLLVRVLDVDENLLSFWTNVSSDGILNPAPLNEIDLTVFLSTSTELTWNEWTNLLLQVWVYQNSLLAKSEIIAIWKSGTTNEWNFDAVFSKISERYKISSLDTEWILSMLGITTISDLDYSNVINWLNYHKAIHFYQNLGISSESIQNEILPEADNANILAFRNTLQQRFGASSWYEKMEPVRNDLRERQRDALVAYILGGFSPLGQRFRSSDELFAYYLMDTQTNSDVKTSRLKRAISSIQHLVQRILLGLEPSLGLSDEKRTMWLNWMKNYRVWEANRKVFLYPENWLEPELRDDKTPFFKELEEELEQSDISEETAKNALVHYMNKCETVANLRIMGSFKTESDKPGFSSLLYVVGRTHAQPYRYYFRKYYGKDALNGVWEPWEKVQAEIASPAIIPTVHNGKFIILWPSYKVSENTEKLDADENEAFYNPKSNRQVEIGLNWVSYQNGVWSNISLTEEPLKDRYNSYLETNLADTLYSTLYHYKVNSTNSDFLQVVVYAAKAESTQKLTATGEWTRADQTIGHLGNIVLWKDGQVEIQPVNAPRTTPVTDYFPARAWMIFNGAYESSLAIKENSDYGGFSYPRHNMVFEETPNDFLVMPTNLDFFFTYDSPFFYQDTRNSYLMQRVASTGQAGFNASSQLGFNVSNISHTLIGEFLERFSKGGLKSLMARDTQALPAAEGYYYSYNYYNYYFNVYLGYYIAGDWRAWDLAQEQFENRYLPTENVASPYPIDVVDFNFGSAMGIYNWEIFFHIPMFIARKLSVNNKFKESYNWFHSIFNPEGKFNDYEQGQRWVRKLPKGCRFWNFLPFFANQDVTINVLEQQGLASESNPVPDTGELSTMIDEWKSNPFNPHLIARYRIAAYQKSVVMKYLDNLIDWGDSLFRQDTIESITEATQIYVLADEILGPKPEAVPALLERAPLTFADMNKLDLDVFGNLLANAETSLLKPSGELRKNPPRALTEESQEILQLGIRMLYFCTPRNEKLLHYWDVVADRVFKIRNSMNIDGVKRQLALFAPPIDPAMLVKAAAAGLDLRSVFADINAPLPPYRYRRMVAKAIEVCQEVKSLGTQLLSVLEKKDAEQLSQLRQKQTTELLELNTMVRELQISEAKESILALQKSKEITEERRLFYSEIEKVLPREEGQIENIKLATVFQLAGQSMRLIAGGAVVFPDVSFGFLAGLGGGPINMNHVVGGEKSSSALSYITTATEAGASLANAAATIDGIRSSFERRWNEWKLQERLAEKEIAQIEQQIVAAEIRKQIFEKEMKNLEKEIEHSKEVYTFLERKYTNKELYQWLIKETTKLHSQMYQLAYDVSKKAERNYQFELGLLSGSTSFIKSDNWDSQHKGLLAGERLMNSIHHMDASYLENNHRKQEIIKTISLAELNPVALDSLRYVGSCEFAIPEWLYDLDFPGQYRRRIKSVRVSIPCVAGPHTEVNAKLRLVENRERVEENHYDTELYYSDEATTQRYMGTPSVSLSKAIQDSGLFELNYSDDRYLPFEGAGAISSWTISLPGAFEGDPDPDSVESTLLRAFDYTTITDVVFEVSYTAHDSTILKSKVKDALESLKGFIGDAIWSSDKYVRTFSLKRDFPNVYHAILKNRTVDLKLEKKHFPYFIRDVSDLAASMVELKFVMKEDSSDSIDSFKVLFTNSYDEQDFLNQDAATGSNNVVTLGLSGGLLVEEWVIAAEDGSGKHLEELDLKDIEVSLTYIPVS
jgi:hypothetical protein